MSGGTGIRRLATTLALLAVLATLALVLRGRRAPAPAEPEKHATIAPAATAETRQAPAAAAPAVASPAAATPTPGEVTGGRSSYVVPWAATPSVLPATPGPEAAPPPRATRSPQPCVEYTWTADDSPAVLGQMLVEIRVKNRCGRVLQPLEVLFRAEGWHAGSPVYSAQGNLLEKIYPDSVRTVMIALTGSTSYYDRVEVTQIDPPLR
jgi:hypothetical protein